MAPTFVFPAPVLSVDVDVVRELEGGEALTGLWNLFTKCKASLEDGHRLENISWRLWYRELAATPRHGRISVSEHDGDGNLLVDTKTALGNEQEDNYPEMEQIPSTHVPLPPCSIPTSSPHSRSKSPTVATVGSISTLCHNSFGKIIVDMLPNPVPPTALHPCKESAQNDASLPILTLNQSTAPPLVADTHSLPIHCSLPTPTASEQHLMPPSTLPAQTPPGFVPDVQVDPAPPTTPPSTLPQLVIVHPTPGPTPHPTPPASPILGLGPISGHPKPIEAASTMAAAAFPSPKFTLHADGSTTSSSSDSSSTSGRINTFSLSATMTSTDSKMTVAAIAQRIKPATPAAVSLANGSGSPLTNIPAPPPPSGMASSASHIPQPSPTPAPVVRKAHSSPTPALGTEPSRARPRAPGNLRQTSSAGGSSKGKDGQNKSKSRSRSRGRGAEAAARAGLMMTSAGGRKGSNMIGGAQRGRAVGLRKSVSGKGAVTGRGIAREKRPTFNIGSHSDDVGSKSAGSGSSVSNTVNGTQQEEVKKEKQSTLAPPQRQQSASRMPPPLRHPLPDPATVLPSKRQQSKIVLATSDSDDYETETDVTESDSEHGEDGAQRVVEEEGDTADWSSEDMSADDVEFVRTQPASGQSKKGHVQPQHRSNSTANIAATHHNHNHTNNMTHNRQRPAHLSRAQQSRRNHAANAQYVVEQAALEAERLRDMFAKKPVPSSEDLVKQRTRSVGLLTQLMHPNPEIFPPTHPYRRGHSSGDVKGTRGLGSFGGGLAMTSTNVSVNGNQAGARTALGQGQASTKKKQDVQPPQRRASAGPAPGIKLSKSVAATPVASQVQVGSMSSVSHEASQGNAAVEDSEKSRSVSGSRGEAKGGVYRPKGRPVDQEMEDTESEGESGDAANGILVSKSVAQEKLKALAARKGIVANDRKEQGENAVPRERESEMERKGRRTTSQGEYHHTYSDASISRLQQAPTPTPIPLGHPYNLPLAAPPSTPRTTRRLMLQTEMSESLRRNLLWERQVSKVNRIRRSSSGGVSGKNGGTVLGGGPLRPLTMLPSVVQLTAKQPGSGSGSGSNTSTRESKERPGSDGIVEEEREREERKERALARNRSWANEFHYTGW